MPKIAFKVKMNFRKNSKLIFVHCVLIAKPIIEKSPTGGKAI